MQVHSRVEDEYRDGSGREEALFKKTANDDEEYDYDPNLYNDNSYALDRMTGDDSGYVNKMHNHNRTVV